MKLRRLYSRIPLPHIIQSLHIEEKVNLRSILPCISVIFIIKTHKLFHNYFLPANQLWLLKAD